MKRWKKEFYELDNGASPDDFYKSQRKCVAIFEEIGNTKPGLYVAQIMKIEPLEDFKVQGVVGCDTFQHCVNEMVCLQRHDPKKGQKVENVYWYDPVVQDRNEGEGFIEIDE